MMQDAQVHLRGFVATEPKFKKVADDVSSAKMRVAYTTRRLNRETGEWVDGATTFVNVVCWRGLADNVTKSLRKGEPVLVVGRLHIRSYNDTEGRPRTAAEVEATAVGHDLSRGVSNFSRTLGAARATAPAADGREPGEAAEPDEGLETGANGDGAANGDGVVDERAVAEFAKELNESLGADAVAEAGA
jgi:single-strand DNA-binding protein